jgi:hypothetical protein
VELTASLSRTARGVLGELTLVRAGGAVVTRQIEAARCDEALDALALVAALLLDPVETEKTAPPRAPPARRQAATPRPNAPAPEVAGPSPPPSYAQAYAHAPPPAPAEPSGAQARPSAPMSPAPATDAPGRQADAADEPARRGSLRLSLLASALLVTGVAPAPRPAMLLGAALAHGPSQGWLLAARGGFRLGLPHSQAEREGEAHYRWWSSMLALCAGGRLRGLSLSGCGVSELGRTHARGAATERPRGVERPWLALGPALDLAWQLSAPVALALGGELLFPLLRDRYWLADQSVHSVPRLTVRAELGLRFRIL